MKRTHKLLSILLAIVLVLGMMPTFALTARAGIEYIEVSTQNAWEIQQYLRMDGNVWITLSGDADWMLQDADYEPYLWHDRQVWAKIGKGIKVLDLNGHRLYLSDEGNAPAKSVMMVVPQGASMNIFDNVGEGQIWMDGQMKSGEDFYGDDGILVRDVIAVTGGVMQVSGGEIHAGRAKEVWCNFVSPNTRDWEWGGKYNAASTYCGYATKFNSGTAITVESGWVEINGGSFWGRGWDNISIISRVPNNGAGADGHRDRCAALRVTGDGEVEINGGSFYGRSDADAVQVEFPSNVTVTQGYFDVSTNDWLVTPQFEAYDFAMMDNFEVTEGWLGSYEVPRDSIAIQSHHRYPDDNCMLIEDRTDPNYEGYDYYKLIDQVDLAINGPLAYETAVTDKNQVYQVPEGASVASVTWYENGEIWENPEISYFKEGYDYAVAISLQVDDVARMKFLRELSSATINGVDAMVLLDERYGVIDRTQAIILMADFGTCQAALEQISLYTGEPMDGHTIDYTVT